MKKKKLQKSPMRKGNFGPFGERSVGLKVAS